MKEFFKGKTQEAIVEGESLAAGIFLPESGEEAPDGETTDARKKELLANFTNKRFTEITRAADVYNKNIDVNVGNNLLQIINMPALEALISKIVEEKIDQYEMQAKMKQALKETEDGC